MPCRPNRSTRLPIPHLRQGLIAASPCIPAPLPKRINMVSTWSSRWCPIATALDLNCFIWWKKTLYRIVRAISSILSSGAGFVWKFGWPQRIFAVICSTPSDLAIFPAWSAIVFDEVWRSWSIVSDTSRLGKSVPVVSFWSPWRYWFKRNKRQVESGPPELATTLNKLKSYLRWNVE